MMIAFLILLLLAFINYVLFLLFIYRGLGRIKKQKINNETKKFKVAVIIPFRNERVNLPIVVESLTKQSYDKNLTELIFVDDGSSDGSKELLESHPLVNRFKILTVDAEKSKTAQKKIAITKAIYQTEAEIIFITDADCTHNENWITEMLKYFSEETGFVSGPVVFTNGSGLFGELQKIEFAGIQIAAAGLIGAGKPATCSAANIAFRKEAFLEVGGYEDNLNLSSGDDEFLMQKIHSKTKYKVKFATAKNVVVRTRANKTLKDFLNQRRRWASKSLLYENKALVVELFLIFLFYLFTLLAITVGAFVSLEIFLAGILAFFIKWFLEYLVVNRGRRLLFPGEKFKAFFVAELLHIPYILIASVLGVLGNFEWKGRKVKR